MKSLAILSLALTASTLMANAEQLMVKSWQRSDGLPQSTVEMIAQTPDGYLWLGTRGGLARFDGVNFKNYSLADGLGGSYIAALENDGEGGLWIGTFGGGLSRLNGEKITTWTTADGLAHNNSLVLESAGRGSVWIGGGGGLQHFDGARFTRVDLPAGEVRALATQADGVLWATVTGVGLFRIDGDHVEPISSPEGESLTATPMFVDRDGTLWASDSGARLLRRDSAGTWTEFDETSGFSSWPIYWFAQDESGAVWLATHREGLFVFREEKFERVTGIGDELPGRLRHVLPTSDGLLWVGTEGGGLCRLSAPDVDFYPIESGDQRGKIHGFVEHNMGEFFVTSYTSGLFHGSLNAPSEVDRLPEPISNPEEMRGLLTGLRMSSGETYISGYNLILRIDPGSDKIHATKTKHMCTALAEGPHGELWMGTRNGDLVRMVDDEAEVLGRGFSPISGLVRGSDGTWWIGTQGAGLFQWRDEIIKHWTTEEGLPTNVLRTLYLDADETLWIGTGGGGLSWLENGELHSVDRRDGLVNDFIPQILEDDAGQLWLGSHAGIMRVLKQDLRAVATGSVEKLHALVLDESDGMLLAECGGGFSPAGVRGLDGRLYFSTVAGIAAFDPHVFDFLEQRSPRSKIERVTLENSAPASTTFPAGAHELEFRYTAFDYHAPTQLRFRHRLVGSGGGWVDAGGTRAAQFTSLAPGDYVFEVIAANTNGLWSPASSYAFSVEPFFWQTTWFKVVTAPSLLALGAGIAWSLARLRLKRARVEAQLEQQRNHVDKLTRLATLGELSASLAHEINQPLAAILSNAQAGQRFLAKGNSDPDEIKEILEDIVADDQRASKVIDRVRSTLKKDGFKPRHLDLKTLITEVLHLMRSDLRSRGISIIATLPETLPPVRADRVQLQQVLINLILNAAAAMADTPHDKRQLTVTAKVTTEKTIQVSVVDHGHGIQPGQEENIFAPYHTTREEGLGLGLSMSRSILIAHDGKLWAENTGKGAAFHFTIPTLLTLD